MDYAAGLFFGYHEVLKGFSILYLSDFSHELFINYYLRLCTSTQEWKISCLFLKLRVAMF